MKQRKDKWIRGLAFVVSGILYSYPATAQIHTPVLPQNRGLITAEEQFQQEQYSSALQSAERYVDFQKHNRTSKDREGLNRAAYYIAVSALKAGIPGSVDTAVSFINVTPDPVYKQRCSYALAQYYFHNNELSDAIPYYEQAGIANLSNKEIANAKFELAYCYFNVKQFDKAEPLLASIKELEGKYYLAGNYYYGLLAYNQGDYANALKSFERTENDKEYRDIVPYYIAEIHYFMGDKERALQDAKRLIKRTDKLYYDNELYLLAAQVLFEDAQYSEALPYFEHYYQHTDKIRKEDLYEMAYCYYKTQQWQNAVEKFKPLSDTRDSLGQTAMYLLGDCYLKTGDKKSARNAFSICAEMSFNPGQQEASLLLSAKLSYEMGYNDDALSRINELLTAFPGTSYKDEAKTLLSDLLIKTNNYAEAYKALEDVTNKDAAYWRVSQKVTYGYAMQQMQAGNYSFADELLNKSLEHPVNPDYEVLTDFWKGEIAYKLQHYTETITYTQRFLNAANGNAHLRQMSSAATLENANLNMGYASMELNDFKAAQQYFSKARQSQDADNTMAASATLHEADAVFMQKDYSHALSLYDQVIAANGVDADYARYQKAIILGLQGRNADKATLLQSLIDRVPASAYAAEARYEMALTNIEDDKYQAAINVLQPLTTSTEKRNLIPKAWSRIGFAYQQLNNTDKAIEAYKHVVSEYPTSDERPAAVDALRSLYLLNNRPDEYAQLLKDNNLAPADQNSLDSAYYNAAENQFAGGKWESARQSFTQYLNTYPNGIFSNKAHYYKAESDMHLKDTKDALAEYSAVLANPWSDFSENSARQAAVISFQNKDYASAMNYYTLLRNNAMGQENLLQAYSGLMLSSYNTDKFEEASAYADTVLSLSNTDETVRTDALLYKARSLQKNGKNDEALNVYKQLENAKAPAIATEARYYIAASYLQQDKLKEAEEATNRTIQSGGSDYWVVKSYILMSDILVKEGDYFNAKATLQSIVKNTKIPELKQEASARLEEVKAMEKKQSKLSEQ